MGNPYHDLERRFQEAAELEAEVARGERHSVCEHGSQGEYLAAAVGQYAHEVGRSQPDRQWVSTPLDTWERNPFYTGPDQRHPEDDSCEC